MNSQFSRKAKSEPTKTPTAIKQKPSTKLAGPKPRSATVVLKRRNRRRRNNEAASGFGGGKGEGGGGGGGGGGNKDSESFQFVPVRHKPLGEYLALEEQPAPSRPTASPSYSPLDTPPMSYAAAVESLPESRLKIKVELSPRLKLVNNHLPVKRQSPKNSPDNKFKTIKPPQSKPNIAQVNPKQKVTQATPQPRVTQVNSKPISSPAAVGSRKSRAKRSKMAKQQKRAEDAIKAVQVPQTAPKLLDSSPELSEAFIYLNHHHERMQRILAQQTAEQKLRLNSGQVKPCKLDAQHSTLRSLFDFDERLFKRGNLEAAALLAQNKAMLRQWLNPSFLIS
ncbi:uncharacterized protein LOC128257757 [Drosophila gunungcola]|uniref:Uncharacterized protein n=1 Tax=Drosophila gunungcola TaxID=103775 RepID=A0A9P9YRK9_9MUSC|nr:uncharacterized protein LOC128257757 [Drosophila gunungcola]KAI8041772.1 hypothetical protein M5D96_006041 [Drosophila gunungcola]